MLFISKLYTFLVPGSSKSGSGSKKMGLQLGKEEKMEYGIVKWKIDYDRIEIADGVFIENSNCDEGSKVVGKRALAGDDCIRIDFSHPGL